MWVLGPAHDPAETYCADVSAPLTQNPSALVDDIAAALVGRPERRGHAAPVPPLFCGAACGPAEPARGVGPSVRETTRCSSDTIGPPPGRPPVRAVSNHYMGGAAVMPITTLMVA